MSTNNREPFGPLRIAVLAGGNSAERAISLESGAAVRRALEQRGHEVVPIDPAEIPALRLRPHDHHLRTNGLSVSDAFAEFDAVFLALHGTGGEDGRIQEILEAAAVPFTGSDSTASRLAFSKSASKERFVQHGVPTPAYVLIHKSDDAARINRQAEKLGFPLVVKPDAQGSSLGVSVVRSREDLPRALTGCFHYDDFGILEAAIAGSEWTVGFLDDHMLPAIQIETDRPFFDYRAKYEEETTSYRFEFLQPARAVGALAQAARGAREALGTKGLARVDLRLDEFDRPWVLEVNTIPGLTGHSLVPKAAAREGIELGELCERAVRACLTPAAAGP